MNVWTIVKDAMKITKAIGGKIVSKNWEIERRKAATRFIWMPGKRPVIVPIATPAANAIINSIIIELILNSGI